MTLYHTDVAAAKPGKVSTGYPSQSRGDDITPAAPSAETRAKVLRLEVKRGCGRRRSAGFVDCKPRSLYREVPLARLSREGTGTRRTPTSSTHQWGTISGQSSPQPRRCLSSLPALVAPSIYGSSTGTTIPNRLSGTRLLKESSRRARSGRAAQQQLAFPKKSVGRGDAT